MAHQSVDADGFIDAGVLSLADPEFADLSAYPEGAAAYSSAAYIPNAAAYPSPLALAAAAVAEAQQIVAAATAPTGGAVAAAATPSDDGDLLALLDASAGGAGGPDSPAAHGGGFESEEGYASPAAAAARASLGAVLQAAIQDSLDAVRASLGLSGVGVGGTGGSGDDAAASATVSVRTPAPVAALPPPPPPPPVATAATASTTTASASASTSTSSPAAAAPAVITDRPLRIAVAQVHGAPGDPLANVSIVRSILQALATAAAAATEAVDAAVTSGGTAADLLVFPELWLSGYHIGRTAMHALAMRLPTTAAATSSAATSSANTTASSGGSGGSSSGGADGGDTSCPLAAVAALAAEYRTAVAVGFPELVTEVQHAQEEHAGAGIGEQDGASEAAGGGTGGWRHTAHGERERQCERVYNSLVVFDADGRVVGHYRKCHLWGRYERDLFAFGPGPGPTTTAATAAEPGVAAAAAAAAGTAAPSPYGPSSLVHLRAFPSLPLGLLVCFDMEFPEPARALALSGAKLLLACVAMGEGYGLSSRVYARARACENGVAVVYANYPSAPTPPPLPAASALATDVGNGAIDTHGTDAIETHYSGGSCVAGPDGSLLYQLPAYVFPGPGSTDKEATQAADDNNVEPAAQGTLPGATSRYYPSAVNAAVAAALGGAEADVATGCLRVPHHTHSGTGGSGSGSGSGSGGGDVHGYRLGPDEHVFVVHYHAAAARYTGYAARNPYLRARRTDLYPSL